MKNGFVEVICGEGRGKSAMALGRGIHAAAEQQEVMMIQFLKGRVRGKELEILRKLEPELKIFRFERADAFFADLNEEEKAEERSNIRNGFHFARKVLATGECDLLIMDEALGLVEQGIVTMEEFLGLLDVKDDGMGLILTGTELPEELKYRVDRISRIEQVKVDKWEE